MGKAEREDARRCVQCNGFLRDLAHPWAGFLHARARVIAYLHDEGKDDVEIATILSADPVQVTLIRNRDES